MQENTHVDAVNDDENVPDFADLPLEQQRLYAEALLRCGYDLAALGITLPPSQIK